MVLASPVCEYVNESESTDKEGVCKTKRKGCAEQVSRFTLADATRAGLLGKQGPWQTNTSRMLKLRARGFGLRDTFADVLAGLVSAEEALDLPAVEAETPAENMMEATQPITLKDKLRAKVDVTNPAKPTETAAPSAPPPPQALLDADYLSQVLDCENFLRDTVAGTGSLRSIRAGFKLEGGVYPLFHQDQAAYLADLQRTVKRMQAIEP